MLLSSSSFPGTAPPRAEIPRESLVRSLPRGGQSVHEDLARQTLRDQPRVVAQRLEQLFEDVRLPRVERRPLDLGLELLAVTGLCQ